MPSVELGCSHSSGAVDWYPTVDVWESGPVLLPSSVLDCRLNVARLLLSNAGHRVSGVLPPFPGIGIRKKHATFASSGVVDREN
mmetsp:Transcript_56438/g.175535  ORF Transcript_56438/g.175535 Transcript_56438/m.175535 type:complete len:84 (-) Transcript_56438:527-778(-)